MRKNWWPGLVLLAGLMPGWGWAEGYVGANVVGVTYADDDLAAGEEEVDFTDLMVKLGGNITRYWTMELRAGTTLAPYETDSGSEVRHHYHASVMARLQYPFGMLTPYVAGGRTRVEFRGGGDNDFTVEDTSYAGGLDIRLGESFGLNLEYAQLFERGDITVEAPSVGVFYAF